MPIAWYFDFVSMFSWLQWPAIRELAEKREVTLRPILLGALLKQMDQRGPAEISRKREFTYRYALWRARRDGVPLRFPPAHPFNPLPALRLCIAAGTTLDAVGSIFEWIWAHGRAADTAEALAPLAASLGIDDLHAALAAAEVKAALQANFEEAMRQQVYGVPTLAIGDELFWGSDAHAFAMDYLAHPEMFAEGEMARLGALPIGLSRL
ncbi:2-hydroxychromene-2-carboxylate isomerase [Luteibacter sp. UNCMF366Tsu5.1]|uniref:2-hydroxychromene-2-carboxylate isomerase n=1 Tax=Luteibacter sp. UNCMF366Tsu5.1 TaxID=1502758 RepID=UPI0009090A84|nr:DsbA family protein [Luteibacter sp. UNCMF366Tsu5.1]SFW58083.1 2-hydroxychromene-2-carboxylate isomerase [Luteibacter sp. UNCMF366Tsu5.1]